MKWIFSWSRLLFSLSSDRKCGFIQKAKMKNSMSDGLVPEEKI